jgi:hypothetical protein
VPQVYCKICKKEFYSKPYWLKEGYGRYCSKKCHHEGLKKGRNILCFVCRKETYKQQKALTRSKSKKFFCGKSCQTKWRNTEFVGEKHANWIHGRQSYKSVLTRNKVPAICNVCKIKDKRVLAVHHKDRNRLNNKLNNLVWLCHNCHHLVHHYDVQE